MSLHVRSLILRGQVCGTIAAGLAAIADIVLVRTYTPELQGAPSTLLGLVLISMAAMVPAGAFLALIGSAIERRSPRGLKMPSAALNITALLAITSSSAILRIADKTLDRFSDEFPGPVQLDMAIGTFCLLVAITGLSGLVVYPALRRALSAATTTTLASTSTSTTAPATTTTMTMRLDRTLVAIELYGLALSVLYVIHAGFASIHIHQLVSASGPLVLLLMFLAVRTTLARFERDEPTAHRPTSTARRPVVILSSLLFAIWTLLLVATSVVLHEGPRVRYMMFARAGVALPFFKAYRSVLDFDGDGSPAEWMGGTDCAPWDPSVGPFQREVPNDGIDQDCRGGDAIADEPSSPNDNDDDQPTMRCVRALKEGPRPNILLLTLDTVRADALDASKLPWLRPFLDHATHFTRAYAPSTHTTGSLPAMITGLPLSDLGGANLLDGGGRLMPHAGLARALKTRGYRTIALNQLAHDGTIEDGFDRFSAGTLDPSPLRGAKTSFSAGAFSDIAVDTLAALRRTDEPFFLWVHYLDPHAPYVPIPRSSLPQPDGTDYEREVAYTSLRAMRVIEATQQEQDSGGSARGTVVAFTSDHGEDLGRRGREGHGPDLYDSTTHVPLVLLMPGCPSAVIETPVSLLDLAPTLDELSAGQANERPSKEPPIRDTLLAAIESKPRTLPVVSEVFMAGEMRRSVVVDDHKLIVDVRNGGTLLFDLRKDPDERNDIYAVDVETTKKLEASYQRWLDRRQLDRRQPTNP